MCAHACYCLPIDANNFYDSLRLIVERHAVVLEVFMGLVLHNPLVNLWIISIVKYVPIVRSALEPSHPILVEILEPRPTQAYVKTECINRVCVLAECVDTYLFWHQYFR